MKMVQIRNVPDDVHRQLKARAALLGQSLSDYALAELRRSLERPTRDELLERVRSRANADVDIDVVAIVREERDGR
ncbi:MAG: hypothetical protein AAGA99_18420 [Actinomycetota bacterium]